MNSTAYETQLNGLNNHPPTRVSLSLHNFALESDTSKDSFNLVDGLSPEEITQEYLESNAAEENFDEEIKVILNKEDKDIADINELVPELDLDSLWKKAKEWYNGPSSDRDNISIQTNPNEHNEGSDREEKFSPI